MSEIESEIEKDAKVKELEEKLWGDLRESISSFLEQMQFIDLSAGAALASENMIALIVNVTKFLSPDKQFYWRIMNNHIKNLLDCEVHFGEDDECYLLGPKEGVKHGE